MNITELMNTWLIFLLWGGALFIRGSHSMTAARLLTPTHWSHRLLKQPCVSMKHLRPRQNCLLFSLLCDKVIQRHFALFVWFEILGKQNTKATLSLLLKLQIILLNETSDRGPLTEEKIKLQFLSFKHSYYRARIYNQRKLLNTEYLSNM